MYLPHIQRHRDHVQWLFDGRCVQSGRCWRLSWLAMVPYPRVITELWLISSGSLLSMVSYHCRLRWQALFSSLMSQKFAGLLGYQKRYHFIQTQCKSCADLIDRNELMPESVWNLKAVKIEVLTQNSRFSRYSNHGTYIC